MPTVLFKTSLELFATAGSSGRPLLRPPLLAAGGHRASVLSLSGPIKAVSRTAWGRPSPPPLPPQLPVEYIPFSRGGSGGGGRNGWRRPRNWWHVFRDSRRLQLTTGLAAAGTAIIVYSSLDYAPITGRARLILMPTWMEIKMGQQAYEQLLEENRTKIVPHDSLVVRTVEKVGRRIIEHSRMPELQNLPWEFTVLDSPLVNAMVLPGGKVVVFTGILPVMHDVDGVATVLSHEIAHVAARHVAEKATVQLLLAIPAYIIEAVTGLYGLPQILTTLLLGLPHSRLEETEADYIGLILMARACFDVTKAPQLWKRMKMVSDKMPTPPQILSTHPAPENRQQLLQQHLPEALQEQEKAGCRRGGDEKWPLPSSRKDSDHLPRSPGHMAPPPTGGKRQPPPPPPQQQQRPQQRRPVIIDVPELPVPPVVIEPEPYPADDDRWSAADPFGPFDDDDDY